MHKFILASLVSAALIGCNSSSSDGEGTGTMNLAFSDAPVDNLTKVCVAFDAIKVHHANGSESSWGTTSFAAYQSSPECIPQGASIPLDVDDEHPKFMVINLMAYQGAQALQVLSDEQLTAGQYTQTRLSVLEKGSYPDGTPYSHVVTDTDTVEGIRVPSGELKLDGFSVEADATQAYTMEFDLRKSMVSNANGYQLKPRGVRLVNNDSVATISGQVEAAGVCDGTIDEAYIYVYQAPMDGVYGDLGSVTEPYATAGVDAETGEYEIGYLPLGTYNVTLVCNGSEDEPEQVGEQLNFETQMFVDVELPAAGATINF